MDNLKYTASSFERQWYYLAVKTGSRKVGFTHKSTGKIPSTSITNSLASNVFWNKIIISMPLY